MSPILLDDPWYFPRAAFATRMLTSLAEGVVPSLTLFAERRMGKTEFVRRDLLPAAEAQGWETVYANLWENRAAPETVLLDAVIAHLDTLLKKPAKQGANVKTELNLVAVKVSAELAQEFSAMPEAKRIGTGLERWATHLRKKKRKALLVIDEVQHLATDKKFEDFVAALRTALEANADIIKVVFTGSSQAGLATMFHNTKAAFYGPGSQMPLPQLGDDYLQFTLARTREAYKLDVKLGDLAAIFEAHRHSPYFLRHAINFAAVNRAPLAEAARRVGEALYVDLGLDLKWRALTLRDQAVMQMVYAGLPLFAQDTREQIAKLTGAESVSPRDVQGSLARLEREDWIDRGTGRGAYTIADPVVTAWMQSVISQNRIT